MIILQYEGLCEGGRGEKLGYTRVGTVNMTENKEGQCEPGTEDTLCYTRKASVNMVQKTRCISPRKCTVNIAVNKDCVTLGRAA